MAFYQATPFHEGEVLMRQRLHTPHMDNPTFPSLSPQLSNHLQIAPLLALGTLDKQGRPWTTLLGGSKGLARPLGGTAIGIRTPVPPRADPVVEELVGKEAGAGVIKEEGRGRMFGGLTIDLETRKRVKMYGRMVAGALLEREDEVTGHEEMVAEIQLVLNVEQSLGNCPKYLNSKHIVPATSNPQILDPEISPRLLERAVKLIEKADLFFVSSSQHDEDMDTNHRGGPPGFMRVVSNPSPSTSNTSHEGAVIIWPEYSGNRLYQTLGNLAVNPYAGICVPDFETGDMLYFTGRTEILIGQDAAAVLPRSNLAVKLEITEARFVASVLTFRGVEGERSPYNPQLKYAATEKHAALVDGGEELQQATLLSQTKLTPTISRFKFALPDKEKARYKPGQYVTLDFSKHLDIGYSHMRDEDPRSLNDDFIRTFTASSPLPLGPDRDRSSGLKESEFEITIRKVGAVTDFLFKHDDRRHGTLEVGVKGFGGEFEVRQDDVKKEARVCFVAAGVGITPLLPSLASLDFGRLNVLWSVRREDLGLVGDTLEQYPELGGVLRLFVTNGKKVDDGEAEALGGRRVEVSLRRIGKEDLNIDGVKRFYLCTAIPMRKQLEEWLEGDSKEVVFEDFNF
jgi:NAD(P)H-flavin reductase